MKTGLLTVCLGVVIHGAIWAQTSQIIRVKEGAEGTKTIPFTDRYRYVQFLDGKILYQNGAMATGRFNYNTLLSEMQFINPNGDTLALLNEPMVRLLGVGNDVFLCDLVKGYLEVIADNNGIRLGLKQGLKTVKNEKRGGYGQSSGVSAITNYQFSATGNASIAKLDAKGDLLLIKDKSYFIIDQNNRSYPFNRASLLKVFSKHREQVATYLDNETIDFKKEDDLKKLLKHCSELL